MNTLRLDYQLSLWCIANYWGNARFNSMHKTENTKYHIVGTVSKSIRKFIETVKIDTSNKYENDSVFLNFIKLFEFIPITGRTFQRKLCHLLYPELFLSSTVNMLHHATNIYNNVFDSCSRAILITRGKNLERDLTSTFFNVWWLKLQLRKSLKAYHFDE